MKRLLLVPALFVVTFLHAQGGKDDAAELAKKLSNPIASLISLPLQNNTDYGIGPMKGTRNTLNIQPVVPISISKNVNMIARLIVPVTTQYNITKAGEKQSGLSDATLSAFFSPKNTKNGITWGAGPAFVLPIGTNDYLTFKKFCIGPTAIGLRQTGGWTYGALVNQLWSVAGDKDRADVSQMFLQPFLVHNWKSGAGIGLAAEYTQNWKSGDANIFIIPTVSGVTAIGTQKIQLAVGPRINIVAPENGKSAFGFRAVLVFLFPT